MSIRPGATHLLVAAVFAAGPLSAQSVHATQVVALDNKGGAGGGIFNPANLLGAPDGNVNSLGIGGFVTLGFAVTIVDGPGADFIVSENPFFSGPIPNAFCETVFVEVSSNGADFARFPNAYMGPNVYPGPYGVIHVGSYAGLGGVCPVFFGAGVDPQDVVEAGGDAFDLADLANHPLVLGNKVKLDAIIEVRLVDVVAGVSLDSRASVIQDPGAGSADIDGVTVIQHAGNQSTHAPTVDLRIPLDGNVELTLSDPDGLTDLDPTSLRVSLFGIPIDPIALLSVFTPTSASANHLTLKLGASLTQGFLLRMSVSVKDRAGHRSGATRVRPDR